MRSRARRSARSRALTGPIPSPVATIRSPLACSLTVASLISDPSVRRSTIVRHDSTVKNRVRVPSTSSRSRSSNEASAASNVYPADSSSLTRPTTCLALSPESSYPSSRPFSSTAARPAKLELSKRLSLPPSDGSMCWYSIGATLTAEACSPALCANAEVPTYGCCDDGATFVTSDTAWATRVSSPSRMPRSCTRLSSRYPPTVNRLAFPLRSPYPLAHPCTCVTPARTAASVLATAQPLSSWQWMPRRAPDSATAAPTSASSSGSIPPLVSHSAITSAPASAAVRTTSTAYAGLDR